MIVCSFYLTGQPMAFQAMLSSSASASALPAVRAGEYVSSLPPSVASPSGYPPGHDPALVARYVLVLSSYLVFLQFLPRFDRFVQDGGDPDLAVYLETLVPDMLAYLGDRDLPVPGPEHVHVPLRQRRDASQQASEDRRQEEVQSKDRDQRVKMEGSFGEPVRFQVPFLGC